MHGGDHDHRHVRIGAAKFGEQFEPVHLGHHDVAQNEIERIVPEAFQGHAAIGANGALVTLRFQKCGNHLSNRFFVVRNEDFLFFHHIRLVSGHRYYKRELGGSGDSLSNF